MDLRIELVRRHLEGERMTDLCREYGISRKTGAKFKERFLRLGVNGLCDQSRAPHHIPHKTPPTLVTMILAERERHPTWGPKKLKVSLERRHHREFPAASTIGDVLARGGLVMKKGRHRPRHTLGPTKLHVARGPNDIWCIDYKGQFRLGNGSYCYPLTVTDQFSRYLLGCEAMPRISDEEARDVCQDLFQTHGLPTTIRSDNGTPFASRGLAGLTKLSAYWLRLGIRLERIRPAHPEENGRHERMHRTLKFETAKPPRTNLLQQQERFDAFVDEYNQERPHEALKMKTPAKIYTTSSRSYPTSLPEPTYAGYDDVLRVNLKGFIYISGIAQVYVTQALAGLHVGVDEQPDGRWLLTFMKLDLGHYDPRTNRVSPLLQPPPTT
jgi:transposase InsO family protein